jgi:phosphomannomutase
VGIGFFLTFMAKKKLSASQLRDSYPAYTISKNKIQLTPEIDVDKVLVQMADKYKNFEVDSTDGVKIYIEKEWVHLRKSNTEPIIRIYSESVNKEAADSLAKRIMNEINTLTA